MAQLVEPKGGELAVVAVVVVGAAAAVAVEDSIVNFGIV